MKVADQTDFDDLVPVVREFYEATHKATPHGVTIEDTVRYCIDQGIALFRKEDGEVRGVFLGIFMDNAYSQQKEMHELMWWAVDRSGYHLLRGACARARLMGAKTMYLGIVNTAPDAAHVIAQKIGFEHVETVYRKVY